MHCHSSFGPFFLDAQKLEFIISFFHFDCAKTFLVLALVLFWQKNGRTNAKQIVDTCCAARKSKTGKKFRAKRADRAAFVNLTFKNRKAALTNHGVLRAGTGLN